MSEPSVVLLTRPEIALKFVCGRSKPYEVTSRADFPRPTYAFGNPRWLASEVDTWILDQITRERAARAPILRPAVLMSAGRQQAGR